MHTDQVYDEITAQDVSNIAQACGFASRVQIEADGRHIVWVQVAGDVTLVVLRPEPGKNSAPVLHFFNSMDRSSTTDRANQWNREHGFASAYLTKDMKPCIDQLVFVTGTTRQHLAFHFFVWESNVESFLQHFSR